MQYFQVSLATLLTFGFEVALRCLVIPSTSPAPLACFDPSHFLLLCEFLEFGALIEVMLNIVTKGAILLRLFWFVDLGLNSCRRL